MLPAHAGMVPGALLMSRGASGAPRARGDGPCGFAELREALDGDGQFAVAKCREFGQEYDADEYRALTVEQGKTLKAAGVRAGSPVHAGPFDDTTSRRA